MDSYMILWLTLAIVFLVVEVLTAGLTSIWLVAGALAAFAAAAFGVDIGIQIGVFIFVTAVLLIFTMPIVKKLMNREKQATNYDRVIGAQGIVTEDIDVINGSGQVTVFGNIWSAKSQNGEPIEKGKRVIISKVQGVKVVVLEKEEQNEQK